MARPIKEGLEYFPLDVDIDKDDKLELVEAKYGITGFAVAIKLLMKIYKEGYFYPWGEREQLLFSKRVNVDINLVNDIINDCFKWKFLDADKYAHYGILTSKGIQKRYLEACQRRKRLTLIKDYILIDPSQHLNVEKTVIAYINADNADINSINDDIGTQSKVKESKGEERKEISPPPKPENALWKETTDKLIDEWETLYTHRPDPAFIKDIRSRVYESCSSGQKADAIRQALKQIAEGAHPLSFGRLVTEAANGRASPGSPEQQRKAIQCDEECGRYECGTQKGDVLFDYCIHCKRYQNRDSRAHVSQRSHQRTP